MRKQTFNIFHFDKSRGLLLPLPPATTGLNIYKLYNNTNIFRYVPLNYDENGEPHIMKSIFLGGDQLTEERVSNIKKSFLSGDTDYERFEGIKSKFEDWHLKKTMYEVSLLTQN